ncbi:hypothetical protein [Chitinophaga caseinilytica]|uniref:Uncharacterized protein n=1 Tax=Chitinophaga caseinilytica TaxID=2267521 RepID=A0ABZ2Z9L9_9BACT
MKNDQGMTAPIPLWAYVLEVFAIRWKLNPWEAHFYCGQFCWKDYLFGGNLRPLKASLFYAVCQMAYLERQSSIPFTGLIVRESNLSIAGKEKPRPKEQGLSYLSLYL